MDRISATFSTPLPALLAMPWDAALKWWPAARAIEAERHGAWPTDESKTG